MRNIFMALGGGDEIGASCYYLKINNVNLLLDCGSRLQSDIYPHFNELMFGGYIDGLWEISAVFLSHAHTDHIGALPKLLYEIMDIPIYCTRETKKFITLKYNNILKHSINIDSDCKWVEFYEPIFNRKIDIIKNCEFFKSIFFEDFKVTFFPAGHCKGAAMIYLQFNKLSILYTGDFSKNNIPEQSYSLPPNIPVDLLIVESTFLAAYCLNDKMICSTKTSISHASAVEIITLIKTLRPKKVILVHRNRYMLNNFEFNEFCKIIGHETFIVRAENSIPIEL